jgi:WD repeat and SOF domain-containing protein 1
VSFKMKVKTISRSAASTERECIGDQRLHFRNLDPTYHPFHKAREYTRAVQAAKLDRMFAKPFVGDLENGHSDGVTQTAMHRDNLVQFASGSVDGVVKVWDLASRTCVTTYLKAHSGVVSGLALCGYGRMNSVASAGENKEQTVLSCGEDGYIRQWKLTVDTTNTGLVSKKPSSSSFRSDKFKDAASFGSRSSLKFQAPEADELGLINTWRHPNTKVGGSFKSLDVHWQEDQFATASDSSVNIWNPTRSGPIQSFSSHEFAGDGDTVTVVRYSPSESDLIAHCSLDRGIGLHDTRTGTSLRKAELSMRANCLEWNPMEPYVFAVGNEDFNAYTFDMRNLQRPTKIHKGHVGAIMSIGWAPTGQEFVTGSYDKTVRIFGARSGTSRDLYHTKRMQRVFAVNYTSDNSYIISGSDDTNLRLWKARSNEKVGTQLTSREEKSLEYRQALLKKYKHMPEVNKISGSGKRKGTKFVRKQTEMAQIQKSKVMRKQENRVKHAKPGTVKFENERNKVVRKEIS